MFHIQKYVATLGIRPAEMSGLRELPDITKDALTPIALLAPWLAAVPLSRALDKFEECYPRRSYFVDIDPSYQLNDKPNEAKYQWKELSKFPPNIGLWEGLLEEYPYANPCLLMRGSNSVEDAKVQSKWARKNRRMFCIRISLVDGTASSIPSWVEAFINDSENCEADDYVMVLDFGWVPRNFKLAESNVDNIGVFVSSVPENIPIVISFTSFPKEFSEYIDLGSLKFNSRELVARVAEKAGRPLIYGDWGSTRPRTKGFAGRPKIRIDYPMADSWLFSRNIDENLTFRDAALRVTSSEHWNGNIGIWGEKLIEGAAEGSEFAINSIQKMSAARINIHLHLQAFYDGLPEPESLDQELSDDWDES